MAVTIQSTYTQYFDEALAGNFAHTNTLCDSVSKITETAITFGYGVVRGTGDDDVRLPANAGDVANFVGIVRRTLARENVSNSGATTPTSDAGRMHEIMTVGYIFALCEDGCSPGDDVFLRHTTGGAGEVIGQFRTDADTDEATQITGATWETTTAAGAIGILRLK